MSGKQAHIYLHPINFEYNGRDELPQLNSKFHALLKDMGTIVHDSKYNAENKFVVLNSLYSISIFPSQNIFTYAEANLPIDEKTVLYDILANTADGVSGDDVNIEDLYQRCTYSPNEENPTTMMVLNAPLEENTTMSPYIQFENYQIVYGRTSWLTFRRQILGNHPGDASHFIEECEKYFGNLVFHGNCVSSLDDGTYRYLEICPRKIVYYLSALNDGYMEIHKLHCDEEHSAQPNAILEDFSGKYGLEEPGSISRNPLTRNRRSFVFTTNKISYTIFCDLHLKISQKDDNYHGRDVGRLFNPRIYFNIWPHDDLDQAKIHVGSIGKHL